MQVKLIVVLCLLHNIVFGQGFKDFAFFEAKYDSAKLATLETQLEGYEHKGYLGKEAKNEVKTLLYRSLIAVDDFFKIAQHFKIKVDEVKREKIIDSLSQFIDNYETGKGDIYSAKTFRLRASDPSYIFENEEGEVKALDLNQDQKIDLILIPKVFFGPSLGYKFYAVEQNGIRYLYENPTDIEAITISTTQSILKYSLPLFDVGESQVIINFVFDHQAQLVKTHIFYYAGQSSFPKKLNKIPPQFQTKQKTTLRFRPEVDDVGEWTEEMQYDFDNNFGKAKFIKGNIIAYYAGNSEGYILTKKGKWLFVAFFPDTQLLQSSLAHGMEDWKDGQIKPYICGWILEEDIK